VGLKIFMGKDTVEEIKEYAVVKVVALNPLVAEAAVGDQGTVLAILGSQFEPEAFEVECVNSDGTNKWLGTFYPEQIELVQNIER